MFISTLIIAVSMVLFLYWFRYTCVLILSTRTTRDYSESFAEANKLAYTKVQGVLSESASANLDALQASLERDYRLVNNLLKQAVNVQAGGDSLEESILRIDFRVMQAWYSLSRRFSDSGARSALGEMTQIVAHFANCCGERATDSAGA